MPSNNKRLTAQTINENVSPPNTEIHERSVEHLINTPSINVNSFCELGNSVGESLPTINALKERQGMNYVNEESHEPVKSSDSANNHSFRNSANIEAIVNPTQSIPTLITQRYPTCLRRHQSINWDNLVKINVSTPINNHGHSSTVTPLSFPTSPLTPLDDIPSGSPSRYLM